jgi:hypothetical protein
VVLTCVSGVTSSINLDWWTIVCDIMKLSARRLEILGFPRRDQWSCATSGVITRSENVRRLRLARSETASGRPRVSPHYEVDKAPWRMIISTKVSKNCADPLNTLETTALLSRAGFPLR